MATLFKRINKTGSITWRVMFRRKGIKPFFASFNSQEEAKNFIDQNEEIYCLNPDDFHFDHLKHNRVREFS